MLRIGVTDWNLNVGASPDAVPLAARLGFDGLQVSFGRKIVDNRMPVDNPEVVGSAKKSSLKIAVVGAKPPWVAAWD